jgi:hypothetical protein
LLVSIIRQGISKVNRDDTIGRPGGATQNNYMSFFNPN